MRYLIVFTIILCVMTPGYATIYKWADDEGAVHFTDDPKKIPEKFKEKAKDFDKEEHGGTATYDPALGVAESEQEGKEPFWKQFLQKEEERAEAAREPKVILYMAEW